MPFSSAIFIDNLEKSILELPGEVLGKQMSSADPEGFFASLMHAPSTSKPAKRRGSISDTKSTRAVEQPTEWNNEELKLISERIDMLEALAAAESKASDSDKERTSQALQMMESNIAIMSQQMEDMSKAHRAEVSRLEEQIVQGARTGQTTEVTGTNTAAARMGKGGSALPGPRGRPTVKRDAVVSQSVDQEMLIEVPHVYAVT